MDAVAVLRGAGAPQGYAESLEAAVRGAQPAATEYRARVRHLAYNLRRHPRLLESPPEEVARMPPERLRGSEPCAAEPSPQQPQPPQQQTFLQCNKCKSWDTEWTTVQTRGADEAATIFARCNSCKRNWKPSNG